MQARSAFLPNQITYIPVTTGCDDHDNHDNDNDDCDHQDDNMVLINDHDHDHDIFADHIGISMLK